MANFTITVVNSLNVFGANPPPLWGVMVWGVDKWGNGSVDLPESVRKMLKGQTLASADVTHMRTVKVVTNALALSGAFTAEMLQQGIWSYVFPGDSTNVNNRIFTNYVSSSITAPTWAAASTPATSWS